MTKPNIGMVCYPSYGGSGVVATELGLALANRGYNVHFISYETPFRLSSFHERIRFHEVDMMTYPLFKYPLYSLTLTSKIVEVCENFDIDILHVHYAIPHAICAYLAKQMIKNKKPKLITTLHGTDVSLVGLDKAYFRLVQFGIQNSDAVTSVSQYLKNKTASEFNTKKHISVIPNFVNLDKFSPNKKDFSYDFFDNSKKHLIHISNFRDVKNAEIVIKVFATVVKEYPKLSLILIGDGPDLSKARLLASKLNVINKIHFLGKAERIECILPYTDIIILPSKMESFGLVLLEAMSAGVTTISSNTGGIPELVLENQTGFMLEPHDYKGMAKKCLLLLENKEKLNKMKLNARKHAANFDQSKLVKQYESLYTNLIQEK